MNPVSEHHPSPIETDPFIALFALLLCGCAFLQARPAIEVACHHLEFTRFAFYHSFSPVFVSLVCMSSDLPRSKANRRLASINLSLSGSVITKAETWAVALTSILVPSLYSGNTSLSAATAACQFPASTVALIVFRAFSLKRSLAFSISTSTSGYRSRQSWSVLTPIPALTHADF